jgi:Plasmid pRiA4b ORF-3-like protein
VPLPDTGCTQELAAHRQAPGIEETLQGPLTARTPLAGLFERQPPSRRRPRRSEVVTYRVRIDLNRTRPPLWRRLELASDLFLDQVHEVIQVASGDL